MNFKEKYAKIGVDVDEAIEKLSQISISMHCWQGDDLQGFDSDLALSGGIQATGNYPGKARNKEELMCDIDKAFSLVPSKHKINLHASYAIFENGEFADRDALKPKHFKEWVEFANNRGIGIDFNPTLFSHPMAKDHLTLSNPDDNIREFWIRHVQACIRISEYFATETGQVCYMNIWIPDGYKDIPADRLSPRRRFKESLDIILSMDYDKSKVKVCLESKLFGIGLESYTVGSSEFCINYAAKNGIISLMDSGHYHPTESISDKIPSMLLFNDEIALHISRPVRWDSDHVVMFDDETREIAKEIVRNNALDRVAIALDYFDASINRVAAWVIGLRNVQKSLLSALLTPNDQFIKLQEQSKFTELLVLQEELKTYPFGEVWEYFCEKHGVPSDAKWFDEVKKYEEEFMLNRI